MYGTNSKNATDVSVIIPHYIFGAVSFTAAIVMMFFSGDAFSGHYFHPKLLAITHTAALGWATMIIFGSLYQFLPVLLDVSLYSERLAKITFYFFAAGIVLLIPAFWNFSISTVLFSCALLILFSVTLFVLNVFFTARMSAARNVSTRFILASVVWLWLTVAAGCVLVFNFRFQFLSASHLHYLTIHAHMGIAGWFISLIAGVSSRLFPMFLLSQYTNTKKLNAGFYFINLGLLAFVSDLLFLNGSVLLPVSGLSVIAGILLYLDFIYRSYKSRVRKVNDVSMKISLFSLFILLLPVAFILLTIFSDTVARELLHLYILYGFLIFFGFISALISGQTYKTLPFIVWMKLYKQQKQKNLLPKDLYSENAARYQMTFYIAAIILVIPAITLQLHLLFIIATSCLLVSALIYNYNIIRILSHK
jgi:hypothetical protein